jgi:bleomycin hydrolase
MEIDSEYTQKCHELFEHEPNSKLMQNILTQNAIVDLMIDRERDVNVEKHMFNTLVTPKVSTTNQKSSGRCWLFAALNVIRRKMIEEYNLPDDFEFSQSYLFFWDKFERLNFNMECIIETAVGENEQPVDSRIVCRLLEDPTCDGGQWDMVINLIQKYGLVPKSVYPESHHSKASRQMNNIFTRKFRQVAMKIREVLESENVSGKNKVDEARKLKDEFNQWTYSTLCKLLGTPPKDFVWRYKDSKDKIHETHRMTPQQFYKEKVQEKFNLDNYVCIINDPRREHPYYKRYTVQYLGNVVGGKPTEYLNVPIEELKNLAYKSIKDNEVVWFGCDVGKSRYDQTMDTLLVNAGLALNTDLNMTKEERLKSGESLMTHAMVFSGLNEVRELSELSEKPNNTKVDRWQVENSWGSKGQTKGFYDMTTEWFDEFVYEVVVHKKHLTDKMKTALSSNQVTVLPLWDPMGALANA